MTFNQRLLLLLKFVRMLAYGLSTMILVPFLGEVGCSDGEIGVFMTWTLLGDVVLSGLITYAADNAGRRFMLGLTAVLMLLSGVCFMFSTTYWVLLMAAILGVISPSGDEVGPFRAIEESAVAQITTYETRSSLFASQNLVGTLGLAMGSLAGGWCADFFFEKTGKRLDAYRVVFFGYVFCAIISLVIAGLLTEAIEVPQETSTEILVVSGLASTGNASDLAAMEGPQEEQMASPFSLPSTLCLLFGIDSLAYGFMTNSWLVEYMMRTFRSPSTTVGAFFFVSTFINALTSFPSAWFADKVGPVSAISLTKLGAGLFGGMVPLAVNQLSAVGLIWLRSLFDTMDVVPRQMFLTTIVAETQRTRVLGLVNVVKTLGRAIGPTFTGYLASRGHINWCFTIMGGLEWVFAIAVYVAFRHALNGAGPIQV